jgi:hypothetical protein
MATSQSGKEDNSPFSRNAKYKTSLGDEKL